MSSTIEHLSTALRDRYRVERELGRGGMATVYLAHDLKHGRQVAVKVLSPELGAVLGAERFLSEIRVTANLQHPNLLPLFDSGSADGLLYYVMPYIEGETLRARIEREQQLPVDEVIRLVTLMAAALDFAHARGVVHRDLKPENILVQAGQPVIADFGIALAVAQSGGERVTQTGLSLGTPRYMSPEQAAGERAVDARSDQYALGALTYEMLMGEPPHTGATAQMIIARVMSETPRSIRTVRPAVSVTVDAAVRRALSKSPADRFATCGDFARALVSDTVSSVSVSAAAPSSRFGLIAFGVIAAALTVLGTVVWLTVRRNQPLMMSMPTIGRTAQVTRDPGLEIDPALSRDGTMIAYAQGPATHMQIYVQQVNGGRRVALTNDSTDHFRSPKWSPDGTQIAYHGNDGIFVVPSLGGQPRRVLALDSLAVPNANARTPILGLAWAPDGQRLAYVQPSGALLIVPLNGGEAARLSAPALAFSPAWSPDGKFIAVAAGNLEFVFGTEYLGNAGPASIWVLPVAGGPASRVTTDTHLNISPTWSPDGRALYWISDRDGSRDIYRAPLDTRGMATAAPARLTTGVEAHGIALAADGMHLAYASLRTFSNIYAIAVPRVGPVSVSAARAVTTGQQIIEFLDVSADGRDLVFDSDRNGNPDIYRMPASGGEATRLTSDSTGDYSPEWSPDGRLIVFHSVRAGTRDIYTMNADGTNVVRRTTWPSQELDPQWSPDGSMVAFQIFGDSTTAFRVVPLKEGEGAWRPLAGVGDFLSWSPTGMLAYHSRMGMRVSGSAADSGRLIVDNDNDGGVVSRGVWSPDGKTLYYLSRRKTGWEIRAIASTGGRSRPLVTFNDPTRQPARYGFATDGRMFYLTIGSIESDLSVLKLETRK
ncbi:MAG: PD40 domain-containing protein [Gemmatimonadaceae bacterium]|nr:PD40 domain-containing protein [Gemmatimonadaceae bacterium]